MFENAKTKTEEAIKTAAEANRRADEVADPLVAKLGQSRYTVVYIVLAAVLLAAVGATVGLYF